MDVAVYSTPCLFAAHEAVHSALAELRRTDGRLPEPRSGAQGVGVGTATRLLERNIARSRGTRADTPTPGPRAGTREPAELDA